MRSLIPEILVNLEHPAPALRKTVIDTLREYLKHTENYDRFLQELLQSAQNEESVINAAPLLIAPKNSDYTLGIIIDRIWQKAHSTDYQQESALTSLSRIRGLLGDDRFKTILGDNFKKYEEMCDTYGLPTVKTEECEEEQNLWDSNEVIEDRVILETEITLKTGPAITMQIHEESRANSVNSGVLESEDDARQGMAVIRILTDESESDYYDETRRTPRKVRFGGESVKMRTPESDSNQEEAEDLPTIQITVTNAVSITTKKSLIPVRISSLPSTPKKSNVARIASRLHHSTPNLSTTNNQSKIPLRRRNVNLPGFKNSNNKDISIFSNDINLNVVQDDSVKHERRKESTGEKNRIIEKTGRQCDVCSPLPVHKEIEVFHNLTRSPERKVPRKEHQEEPEMKEDNQADSTNPNETSFQSFKICPENDKEHKEKPHQKKPDEDSTKTKLANLNDSSYYITSLNSEDESWAKSEALDNLLKMLHQRDLVESLEPVPAALLFEALFACHHKDKLHSLADDALILMVDGMRSDVLEQCLGRLTIGLCKMGAPSGVSLALKVVKKTDPMKLQQEILEHCFGHRTREGALQVLIACAKLLPSKDVEVTKITQFTASSLRDRRRRVRHAALECLATLAHLGSPVEILEIVASTVENWPDNQYLLKVVRARLSRRQLPTIDLDGSVRYSTPRDETELAWLSGNRFENVEGPQSPSSSSTSPSTTSVNYWKRNLRHQEQASPNLVVLPYTQINQDESGNGNSQIWAVDPSAVVNTTTHGKGNGILRPVYVLQQDERTVGGRGHRKYDRGRSFSPPKLGKGSTTGLVGSPAISAHPDVGTTARCSGGVRKSFSSEQIYYKDRALHEPQSFSSRSSTTSTGSSTRSGIWQRSAIPIPISSETKLKIRTSNVGISGANGPVIARRTTPSSPPLLRNVSTLSSSVQESESLNEPSIPPRSSGSESSGYFTPPPGVQHTFPKSPGSQQAFVKLDTEDHEDAEVASNNNNKDCVDSYSRNSISSPVYLQSMNVERSFSQSSSDTHDAMGEQVQSLQKFVSSESLENNNNEKEDAKPPRYSASSLKHPAFTNSVENKNKSRSVVDLQSFLPEITPARKNINSAPLFKDDISVRKNNNNEGKIIEVTTSSVIKVTQTAINSEQDKPEETHENPESRLPRRFARTQSRRSFKGTPRTPAQPTTKSRAQSKPRDTLQQVLTQLESCEWEATVQGLQGLTRIMRSNPDDVENEMHAVCGILGKHVRNLRSQVARTACRTTSELFANSKRGHLEMEFEEVAAPLLQRTADTNKFLRADANEALDVMCEHLPVNRVVAVVTARGCSHQNAVVRAASVRLLRNIVKKLGADKTLQLPKETRDKLLLAGARSLADGSPETRNYGKEMLRVLIGNVLFQRCFREAVPQNILRNITKALNALKPET